MPNNEVTLSQLADAQDRPVVASQEVTNADATSTDTVTTKPTTVAEATKPVKVKKVVRTGVKGRPLDTAGVTTMGRARNIFAADPSMTNIQLRDAIMAETGCKKSVAATYASKVRNPAVAA